MAELSLCALLLNRLLQHRRNSVKSGKIDREQKTKPQRSSGSSFGAPKKRTVIIRPKSAKSYDRIVVIYT